MQKLEEKKVFDANMAVMSDIHSAIPLTATGQQKVSPNLLCLPTQRDMLSFLKRKYRNHHQQHPVMPLSPPNRYQDDVQVLSGPEHN